MALEIRLDLKHCAHIPFNKVQTILNQGKVILLYPIKMFYRSRQFFTTSIIRFFETSLTATRPFDEYPVSLSWPQKFLLLLKCVTFSFLFCLAFYCYLFQKYYSHLALNPYHSYLFSLETN